MGLVGKMKTKVMTAGANLGARVAGRALDALEKVDRVRLQAGRLRDEAPDRLMATAKRVPLVGKRLTRLKLKPAIEAAREVAPKLAAQTRRTKMATAPVSATKIELDPVMKHPEYFSGRKVTTASGRKTMPAAAAKSARAKTAKAQGQGFKPKKGQKHKHH